MTQEIEITNIKNSSTIITFKLIIQDVINDNQKF